jgi:hypothetical protein
MRCTVLVMSLFVSAQVMAEEEPRLGADSYRLQLWALDGAAVAAGLAIALLDETERPTPMVFAASAAYGFGAAAGPAVHWANGWRGMGFASLGVRLLLPPIASLVGVVGSCLAQAYNRHCGSEGARFGFAAGVVGASAIDGLLFSNERGTPSERGSWYGWQIALLDLAGIGLGVYTLVTPNEPRTDDPETPEDESQRTTEVTPLGNVGLGMWIVGMFGPPLAHLVNGEPKHALIDLGVRWVAVPVGMVVGLMSYCAATGARNGCQNEGAFAGLLGGSVVVAAFDIFQLSWHDPDDEDEASAGAAMPIAAFDGERWVLGFAQAF